MVETSGSLLARYIENTTRDNGRLRVWSLVVTIFGDIIEPRGGVVRLGVLQKITGHIGVENNTLRTAMSRLAGDGWVERQRIGRASFYQPSAMASLENTKASKTIYCLPEEKWDGQWQLIFSNLKEGYDAQSRKQLHGHGFGFFGRKLALAPYAAGASKPPNLPDCYAMISQEEKSQDTASFVNAIEFHQDCEAHYDAFIHAAERLVEDVEKLASIEEIDAIALRALLIHNWRRIVLRDVHWPKSARTHDWSGHRALTLVQQAYHHLLQNSENWLNRQIAIPEGKLPPADGRLARRFNR